jgi:hypothetical protein
MAVEGGGGADGPPSSLAPPFAATIGLDFGLRFEAGFAVDIGFGWCCVLAAAAWFRL